jgi:hypothetical protein
MISIVFKFIYKNWGKVNFQEHKHDEEFNQNDQPYLLFQSGHTGESLSEKPEHCLY